MAKPEVDLLSKYLDKYRLYLEFGSGGSTFLAASKNVKITSIDSDPKFIKMVSGISNIHVICADIGPVGEWGYPLSKNATAKWANYSRSYDDKRYIPDLVLVDGRFRVACTLKALIDSPMLLVHDFNRLEYRVMLDFYDIIEQAGTMVVFMKKLGVDMLLAANLYNVYSLDPR